MRNSQNAVFAVYGNTGQLPLWNFNHEHISYANRRCLHVPNLSNNETWSGPICFLQHLDWHPLITLLACSFHIKEIPPITAITCLPGTFQTSGHSISAEFPKLWLCMQTQASFHVQAAVNLFKNKTSELLRSVMVLTLKSNLQRLPLLTTPAYY